MHKSVTITEKQKKKDGIVCHTLEVDGKVIKSDLDYFEALRLALDYISDETKVTEVYESTGASVSATGGLVGGDEVMQFLDECGV